ncbi:hypothetical protein [Microcoleus anatoxicus]|uniref:hypothetical protein n=1 Tax=Microcoleus anatoxicus TaxID=2705319 RepID=UPI0030C9BBE3
MRQGINSLSDCRTYKRYRYSNRLFIDFGTLGIYDGSSVSIVINNASIAQAASPVHSHS